MGRSKFPGKPTKHVNRKRVNVLPSTNTERDPIIECNRSLTVEAVVENKQNVNEDENSLNIKKNPKVSLKRRLNRKIQTTKSLLSTSSSKRNLLSKICNKTGVKVHGTNLKTTRQSSIKQRRPIRNYSLKNLNKTHRSNIPKESNNHVGKFVLPTRSVHSSRVIKPNKRFINVDLSETLTLKKKTINNKRQQCINENSTEESKSKSKSSTIETNITNSENDTLNNKDNSVILPEDTRREKTTFPNGRIVLRQARLKLHTQTHVGTEGPFSSNTANGGSPSGTVTCGVCGAVRLYRFVKQAKKFNIYSCESCRKFISKMIKRQNCGKNTTNNTLICHAGQGMCHVPPVVRTQQMKVFRYAYKARCPACWLKMCLRSFQMPMSLKHSLIQLLPKNMQVPDVIFNNSLPLLWQMSSSSNTNSQKVTNDLEQTSVDVNSSSQTTNNSVASTVTITSSTTSTNNVIPISIGTATTTTTVTAITTGTTTIPVAVKQRPVRCTVAKNNTNCNSMNTSGTKTTTTTGIGSTQSNSDIKRQKIDLKGPRVKHVCRSASIVLGQSIATFPADNDKKSDIKEQQSNCKKDDTKSKNNKNELNLSENELSSDSDKFNKLPLIISDTILTSIKKDRSGKNLNFSSTDQSKFGVGIERKRSNSDLQKNNMLLIDYWDNISDNDICRNGFCIITSQQFSMPAVCFLCGSAGHETLLYCSLCCEPYHPFCLEQIPSINMNDNKSDNKTTNNQHFLWICPKCTICKRCNQIERKKVNCYKCLKTYHPECFNRKSSKPIQNNICFECSTCQDCGNEITTLIGNLSLCLLCFKLKKVKNVCPICQDSFHDMFSQEVMECQICNKWIHIKCDKISEEYFQILSLVSEKIQYVCSICSEKEVLTTNWRKLAQIEFIYYLNHVLRLLSKNKTAKRILKLGSPINNNNNMKLMNKFGCSTSLKKLQNSNEQLNENNSNNSTTVDNNPNNPNNSNTIESDIQNDNSLKRLNNFDQDSSNIGINDDEPLLSVFFIKNKLNSNEYDSLKDFDYEMEKILMNFKSEEVLNIYRFILKSVFPWYKKSASTQHVNNINLNNNNNNINNNNNNNNNNHKLFEDLLSNQNCENGCTNLLNTNNVDNKSEENEKEKEKVDDNDNNNNSNNNNNNSSNKIINNELMNINYKFVDSRICSLCKNTGDGQNQLESRLIYCGQNEWVHINCALWSTEVYEDFDGSLQNVHNALSRGRLMRCSLCKQRGATVNCCYKNCYSTYHFICARNAKCYFLYDKTVYCSTHKLPKLKNILISPKQFIIERSVYVDIALNDSKKGGKYSHIDKVNVTIGSLCVSSLGKINPTVSDNIDVIIPTGYTCTRLFWSTVEPWKLINYKITTSIHNGHLNISPVDKNFTVDHSLARPIIDKKLKEILIWQKDIDKKKQDVIEFDDDEEPQSGADLLSPEITDAIFEELPHELLDGISVQDIFPKLMSYEDFLTNTDYKSELVSSSSSASPIYDINFKSCMVDSVLDTTTTTDTISNKFDDNLKKTSTQQSNNNRSCSLTLSCKLDNTFSPVIKKRKIAPRESSLFFQLLQVDGNFDDSSSSDGESCNNLWTTTTTTTNNLNKLSSLKQEEPVTCERCHCTYRTKASYKRHLDSCEMICSSESDSEVNQEQDSSLTYEQITSNNIREQSSSSSCTRSVVVTATNPDIQQLQLLTSYEAYQQNEILHTSVLNTQTFVSSSKSVNQELVQTIPTNGTTDFVFATSRIDPSIPSQPALPPPPQSAPAPPQPQPQIAPLQLPIATNELITTGNFNNSTSSSTTINRCTAQILNESQPQSQTTTLCLSDNSTPTATIPLCATIPVNSTAPLIAAAAAAAAAPNSSNSIINQVPLEYHQPSAVSIQPVCYSNNIINVAPHTQNQISFTTPSSTTNPTINNYNHNNNNSNNHNSSNINISNKFTTNSMTTSTNPIIINHHQQNIGGLTLNKLKRPIGKSTVFTKTIKQKNKERTIIAKRTNHHDNDTLILPSSNGTTTSTTPVIVQQLPTTTNFIPTFVDPFQQHNHQANQNQIQYVATIAPQINHPQSLVQLQPDSNVISLLAPSVQPTATAVIIQQQPRVQLENQLILDGNGTLSWTSQPIQTIQPLYYGFETIVQNTVMQSQQFLPTTLPGVLTANSSYSTTTQVFQTSKLEPVIDIQSNNGFVLINPSQLVNQQSTIHLSSHNNAQQFNSSNILVQQTTNDNHPCTQKYTTTTSATPSVSISIPTTTITSTNPPQQPPPPQQQQQPATLQNTHFEKIITNHSTNNHNFVAPLPSGPTSQLQINHHNNGITLPTAPFIAEQGIPTNVVTPTPKLNTTNITSQTRPMSRVLPMQTLKDNKKVIPIVPNTVSNNHNSDIKDLKTSFTLLSSSPLNQETEISNNDIKKEIKSNDRQDILITKSNDKIKLLNDIKIDEPLIKTFNDSSIRSKDNLSIDKKEYVRKPLPIELPEKVQTSSSVEQPSIKTSSTDVFKLNNFNKTSSIQIAPLKPIKSNSVENEQQQQQQQQQHPPSPTPPPILPLWEKQTNRINTEVIDKKCNDLKLSSSQTTPSSSSPVSPQIPRTVSPNMKKSTIHHIDDKKDENVPSILYTIETQDGFKYSSTSVADLWSKVFEAVQNARVAHNMPPLPQNSSNIINNLQILGLKSSGLKYLIEQLPGAAKCTKYKPAYNFFSKYIDVEDEPLGHTNGCARCVPNIKRNDPYDMFGWLASKHRKPEHSLICSDLVPRRGSINHLPMAMRFRQLKLTSKYSVGVYRSKIHRRGLFCLRDFEAGEMVIEYSGEVIRSVLTDKREKFYNSKGIGCYMFRIDDNLVVDATMTGNAARFINHSCDPNCYSKVVEILGHKHIIIFALRKIICGEELTYDYKFPIEEDKIPCTCGTRKCRKFLN